MLEARELQSLLILKYLWVRSWKDVVHHLLPTDCWREGLLLWGICAICWQPNPWTLHFLRDVSLHPEQLDRARTWVSWTLKSSISLLRHPPPTTRRLEWNFGRGPWPKLHHWQRDWPHQVAQRETPWSRDVDDLLLFICAAGTVGPPVEPRFLGVFILERKALREVPSNLELLGF